MRVLLGAEPVVALLWDSRPRAHADSVGKVIAGRVATVVRVETAGGFAGNVERMRAVPLGAAAGEAGSTDLAILQRVAPLQWPGALTSVFRGDSSF